MKILGIVGSPRRERGLTDTLVQSALSGAKEAGAAINANEWTHVVGTYDGTTVRIYLNGEVKAEMNASVAIPANASSFVIGGTQESRDWFDGMIDEVKLYNRGLTEDEVQRAMERSDTLVAPAGSIAVTWGNIKSH